MIGLALLLATPVRAQVHPGNAVVAPPCVAQVDASCWEQAPVLQRFAAPAEARQDPLEAAIRMAWNGADLILRIDDLPPETEVEISVSPKVGADKLEQLVTARGSTGLLRLTLDELSAGSELSLHLNLLHNGPEGPHTLPWSPAGASRHEQPATLLLASAPPPRFEVEFSWDGDALQVHAPAASELTLTQDRLQLPLTSRQPPAWSITSRDRINATPPHTGWHHVEARWHDPQGPLIDIQRFKVWVDGPMPEALEIEEIHPAPRWLEPLSARPFQLHEGVRICAPGVWQAPAALLQDELQRFTGIRPELVLDTRLDCDIELQSWTTQSDALPSNAGAMIEADAGFGLRVQASKAVVHATDLQGAVYGSMALADVIGPDGQSPAFRAADQPEMDQRVLFWSLNIRNTPTWSLEQAKKLVRRAMTRGRINLLVIAPTDSLQYSSHPEIAHGRALTPAQMKELIHVARELGIEVIPGLNSPGHGNWITNSHPELMEDVNPKQLCTRHPQLRPLLEDLMLELIEIFDQPQWLHIGRDESHWLSSRYAADERCPRCAGTPRSLLFAEDLAWQIQWLAEREIRPMIWSDMILEGWNGKREGIHHSLSLLSDSERSALMVMAWSPLGDPLENLADQGIDTMRVHTGYIDWKRADLVNQSPQLQGEGLGLFTAAPWRAMGPSAGSRPLHYLWSSIILAGTTAWRPELSDVPVDRLLSGAIELPAFRPGLETIPHGRTVPLTLTGTSPRADLDLLRWDGRLQLEGIRFGKAQNRVATPDQPVEIAVGRSVAGVSLLQATAPTHSATQVLLREQRRPTGTPAMSVIFHYRDGTQASRNLQYGQHTYRPDGDPRSRSLWETSGVLVLGETLRGQERPILDQHLYRVDLPSPHPERILERLEIRAEIPGVEGLIAAASSLEHP